MFLSQVFWFFIVIREIISINVKPPNIVYILADDLGWNDVSFHGSNEILTPNIDALAYNGVILNNHYSETLCSPSRAALLTGKYPIHTGMQHNVVMETHPTGLDLKQNLMPEYLKKIGYKSHAIGKWHLGFFKKEYTPTFRGFDSFYGLWNGNHDYYEHNTQAFLIPFDGYDMRRNLKVDWSAKGHYSTDLFTNEAIRVINDHNTKDPLFLYLAYTAPHSGTYENPLQAPESEVKKFAFIKDPNRRKYAAMVSRLDFAVGEVVEALQKNSMLNNSIIVFVSDNGAPTTGLMRNYGSNWPMKGEKSTPWEGGIRTVACLWSPLLQKSQGKVKEQFMHISDWLPTLYVAAGGNESDLGNGIDGTSLWNVLKGDAENVANYTILHNIDEESGFGYAAIREGPFKYVKGSSMLGFLDDWYGEPQYHGIPHYNIDAIKKSKINKLLSIQDTTEDSFLTKKKILSSREKTKITCSESWKKNINYHYDVCEPFKKPCLFNTDDDPCEKRNLYGIEKYVNIQNMLEMKLNKFRKQKVIIEKKFPDMRSNPKFYNNTWVNWGDLECC